MIDDRDCTGKYSHVEIIFTTVGEIGGARRREGQVRQAKLGGYRVGDVDVWSLAWLQFGLDGGYDICEGRGCRKTCIRRRTW